MTSQAFTETLTFARCQNWDTDACPHLRSSNMQLSIINAPHYWLLNDKTVDELNGLCDGCEQFKKKVADIQ